MVAGEKGTYLSSHVVQRQCWTLIQHGALVGRWATGNRTEKEGGALTPAVLTFGIEWVGKVSSAGEENNAHLGFLFQHGIPVQWSTVNGLQLTVHD